MWEAAPARAVQAAQVPALDRAEEAVPEWVAERVPAPDREEDARVVLRSSRVLAGLVQAAAHSPVEAALCNPRPALE